MRRYGRGVRYRGVGGGAAPTGPAALATFVSSNLEAMAVGSPMSIANMRTMLGNPATGYAGQSNMAYSSVVQAAAGGPWGASTRVFDQLLSQGTFGSPGGIGNGTGIPLTSFPMGQNFQKISIEYDVCFVGSGQWPLGGKLPGVGGYRAGSTSAVPTGGTQSAFGWSSRLMHRRDNTSPTRGFLVGYLYDPTQPTNSYGVDLDTGRQLINWNTVYRVRQEIELNTVTAEGSTTPPDNGVHRIFWNGALVYEDLSTVFRFYSDVYASHEVFDLFLGGNDSSWAAPADLHVQIDNYTITGTTVAGSGAAADTTAPTTPTGVTISNVTASSFDVSWTASSDAVGVTGYSIQVDGATYTTTTGATSVTVAGRAPSTAYAVRVQARDAAGNFSGLSPAVTATTTAGATADTTAPTTPTNVVASNVTDTGFTLAWTASTDAVGVTSYSIQLNGSTYTTSPTNSATVTGLSAGTAYSVRVTARDAAGNFSTLSTAISVTTAAASGGGSGGGTITHGFQITSANTGVLNYVDPTLNRKLTNADLTQHTTAVSASDFATAGGTIKNKWFRDLILIDIDNVTFVGCRFDHGVSGYRNGVHHPFTMNWCTVEGTPDPTGYGSVYYQDYTLFRCYIACEMDGLKANGGVTATECTIRVNTASPDDHNDGAQSTGSYAGNLIQRCNIDARPLNGSGGGAGGPNAALFVADASSGLHKWYDNFVAGGGYVIRCYENATYDVQGNWILDQSWIFGPAARAVIPATAVTWGTARSNLVVSAAGAQVSVVGAP